MKLKKSITEQEFASFEDNNDKTYVLLTNTKEDKLDLIRLAICFLKLEDCVIITDAFNIFDELMPDMYGVYIEESKLQSEPYLFDKFVNTTLIIEDELKNKEIEYDS